MVEVSPYWLVHGDGPTNFRHPTEQSAVREAERLARLHPGRVFVVLESVEALRKVDVERISLRAREEIVGHGGGPRSGVRPDLGDDIPF